MLEYENVFKKQELYEIYTSGEINPLDDLCMVEEVALELQNINKKISFYKEYRRKRIKDITDEVKVLENQVDFFRKIILSTLKKSKEKSVKFPGSCTVSSRNQAHKWVIADEDQFIKVLKNAKEEGENVDDVFEEVITYDIDGKEVKILLDTWEKSGKLDKVLAKNKGIVEKIPAYKTCSISYPKVVEEDNDEDFDDTIPLKDGDFDTI